MFLILDHSTVILSWITLLHATSMATILQSCRSRGVGGMTHQILAGQLTLSQPRRADYNAPQIILAPPDFQTFLRPLSAWFFFERIEDKKNCLI